MIYTKQTLKRLLDYAEEHYDCSKSERQIEKDIKCALVEYDLYEDDESFNQIFLGFISLCCLKCN